jgi:hypothetical protein
MLRSHHPRSTVRDTNNMCVKGTDIHMFVKPEKKTKITSQISHQIKNQGQIKLSKTKVKMKFK